MAATFATTACPCIRQLRSVSDVTSDLASVRFPGPRGYDGHDARTAYSGCRRDRSNLALDLVCRPSGLEVVPLAPLA